MAIRPVGALAEFLAQFDAIAEDPVKLVIPENPVVLPCGHVLDQEIAEQLKKAGKPCPMDTQPFTTYHPVYMLKQLLEARKGIPAASPSNTSVLSATPSTENPFLNAGIFFYEQKKYDEAAIALQAALRDDPQNRTAQHYLTIIQLQKLAISTAKPSPAPSLPELSPAFRPAFSSLPSSVVSAPIGKASPASLASHTVSPPVPNLSQDQKARLHKSMGLTEEDLTRSSWNLSGKVIDPQLLLDALKGCPYVVDLDLTHLLNSQIYGHPPFITLLTTNTTLTRLDLSHNKLGIQGILAIGVALAKNPRLPLQELRLANICESEISYYNSYMNTTGKPRLSSLDSGMGPFLEWLSVMRGLQVLDLSENNFDPKPLMEALQKNARLGLTELSLSKVPISPKDAGILDSLSGDQSLRKLAVCLQGIEQSYHGLLTTAEEAQHDQALKEAEQQGKSKFPTKWSPHWGVDWEKDRRNDFINDQFQPRRAAIFSQVQRRILDRFFSFFQRVNPSLTELDLSCSEIGDYGACLIGRWLESNTTLQRLNLSETELCYPGMRALAASLSKNRNLQLSDLDLSNNLSYLPRLYSFTAVEESNVATSETVAEALSTWLVSSTILRRLNLSRDKKYLQKRKKEYIEEFLHRNKREYTNPMDVFHTPNWGWTEGQKKELTQQAEAAFEQLLSKNDEVEVSSLAVILQRNHRRPLTELNLEGWKIGPKGAAALGRWLKTQTTLKRLNLKDTALGLEGVKVIAQALSGNGNNLLADLNLQGNAIDTQARFMLQEAVPSSCRLLIDS
ncbi:MAG TPA: hypothetical protein VMR37_03560 [Rhabdochlamydiaceae bacterium]|nr:hypothetical protein [Rhabdochlamydiaceae bacterium]